MSPGELRSVAGQRWDYSFGTSQAGEADPALAMLVAGFLPPRISVTLSVAQFAAFKKGLEKHGVELTGVTRRARPEAAPWQQDGKGEDDDS